MTKPTYKDIAPADAREILYALTDRIPSLPGEAARCEEYADLGGYDSQYPQFLKEISHLIGALKRVHAEISGLAHHSHEWSTDDYCRICGADGRA